MAAHTDVGVLTLVTFDAGACGRLEFECEGGGWRAAPADGLLIHAADGIAALAPGAPVIRHRVAATGAEGSRVSLALFVDLPPDHRVRGATTYAAWRRDRVRRARAVGAQKHREDDVAAADERQTALRLYALTPALPPRRILTEAQIAAFIRDGYVVVPGVLSKERLAAARRGLAATLARHGVSIEDAATHEGLRRLSTTRGAGGVLDLFYDRWKLDLTLATPAYADAYRDLFEATYGTNAGLWAHPYGAVAAEGLWAHVDRVGVRVPDAAGKKRALQRSLTPHLDCCPDRLHAGGGKRFPRWRPIQCFLALDDALEADQGGFECCGGFHRRFEEYYKDRAARAGGSLPCVGDFIALTMRDDAAVVAGVGHVPVPAGAAVFWDQRVPHANARRNTKHEARAVAYGGFLPRTRLNDAYATEQRRRFLLGEPQPDFWTDGPPPPAPPDHSATVDALGPLARSLLGIP